MMSSNSFGTNIEKILQEILVTRTKVDELLTEIRNMSTDQINKCNELVNKLLSILQVIDERTKDIENRYAKLISEKNRFVDLTEWNETVLPEIIDIFEEELSGYLTKVLSVEDICERFLVEQLENYKAEQNDTFELTHNVFKADPDNEERMKNYVYGESIGYNWYSVKAQDDYLANDNSLLVVTKYDNDKWSELNAIYKGAVIHETISFHPKYGALHMVTSARERVVSSYTDQETNKTFFTSDIRLMDGFDGNFNELKGSLYNRSVNRDDRGNMILKNDIKYSLMLRHKINEREEPMEPRDYFIMKVRDIEPLENGKPSEYVIQRINTSADNIMNEYTDGSQRFKALRQNPLDSKKDSYMSEKDMIDENLEDNDETLSLHKKIIKINKYNYFDNNLIMNISSKGLLVLLKYQYNNQTPRVYNELAVYGLTNNFKFFIKEDYRKNEDYDLLSNLVMKIMPPNYTNFTNAVSYLTDFPHMEDKGTTKTFENFQIVNTSNYGFVDKLHANELAIYYKEPNTNLKIPNGTVIDRMINVRGNKQYHFLTRYNMQEYYDIYNMPLRYNNYYFYPYMRNLASTNTQSTLMNKLDGLYDTCKSQSYSFKKETEIVNDMKGGFCNVHMDWGYCEDITTDDCVFSNITDDGHVLMHRGSIYDTFYSEDFGKTWKRIEIDYENSPIKDFVISESNKCIHVFRNFGNILLNKNGLVVFPLYNENKTTSAQAGNNSIYMKSVDFGKTWIIDQIVTTKNKTGQTFFANCNSDGIIMAGWVSNSGEVIISTDWGKTWKYHPIRWRGNSGYTNAGVNLSYITDYSEKIGGYLIHADWLGNPASSTNYGVSGIPMIWTKEKIDALNNGEIMYFDGYFENGYNSNKSTSGSYSAITINDPEVYLELFYTKSNDRNPYFRVHDRYGYWSNTGKINTLSAYYKLPSSSKIPSEGNARVTKNGLIFYQWYYGSSAKLFLDVGLNHTSGLNISDDNGGKKSSHIVMDPDQSNLSGFTVNEKHGIVLYSLTGNRRKVIKMVRFKWKRSNIIEDSTFITSLTQKLGLLSNLTSVDVDEIKEEVINRVMKYYEKQSNIYVGTLIQLPFSIDPNSEHYNKYRLCDGSELSKIEYIDLYKVIGDKYNDDSTTPGYFKLPDFRGRTFVGTDSDELIGTKIDNCLPENMEFEVNFNRIDEQDMRSGVIVSGTESSNTRTTVLGGFENGMDRTKFSIDHSSQSQNTIGNMFNVDVYIRVK